MDLDLTNTVNDIFGQFGVQNVSNITLGNFTNDSVLESMLNNVEANDVCGAYDDLNNLFFNPEEFFNNMEETLPTMPPLTVNPNTNDDVMGMFSSFLESAATAVEDAWEGFEDWMENITPMCNSNQRTQYDNIMFEFSVCSGYNMKELIDSVLTNPSVLQMGLKCSGEFVMDVDLDYNVFADEESGYTAEKICDDFQVADTTVSATTATSTGLPNEPQCVDGMLGDNILGEFLRLFISSPSIVCNCLSIVDKLPDCRMSNKMFMDLKQMKRLTCVMNHQTCSFFANVCDDRLNALNECLPSVSDLETIAADYENDRLGTRDTCRDVLCDCETIDNGKMNYPARMMMELPLSDMCIQQAQKSTTFSDIPFRYERFQSVCTADVVNGTEPMNEKPPIEAIFLGDVPSTEAPTEIINFDGTNTVDEKDDIMSAIVSEELKENTKSGKRVQNGIIAAAVVTLLGMLLLIFWARRRRRENAQEEQLEMAHKGIPATIVTTTTSSDKKIMGDNNDIDIDTLGDNDENRSQQSTINDSENLSQQSPTIKDNKNSGV